MPPIEGKKKLQWTNLMDQILIDALLNQVIKCNRVNGQFTSCGLDEAAQEVRANTHNDSIDKEKISNRIKTLNRNWAEAHDMFKGLSGFGWNPITKCFEADEEVWKELIKANPDASSWKTKPIAQYEKACELWGKDRATGENAETAKEKAQRWSSSTEFHHDITVEEIDNMVENRSVILENPNVFSPNNSGQGHVSLEDPIGTQQYGDTSTPTEKRGGSANKKRKREDAVATEINDIKTVMERVADVLAEGNSIIGRSGPRIYSSEVIYSELEYLKIDDDTKFEALEMLVNNQGYARVFVAIPARKAWLLKKLSNIS